MRTAFGLDLGIKTGSLVQINLDEKYNAIESYRILHSWTNGPKIKDGLLSITEYFDSNILRWLNPEIIGYNEFLAIDWNEKEIFWSANRGHSNIKTYISGYICAHCNYNWINVRYTSPQDVREFFGFKQKMDKFSVQRHFLNTVPQIYETSGSLHEKTEHDIDALILAYMMAIRHT